MRRRIKLVYEEVEPVEGKEGQHEVTQHPLIMVTMNEGTLPHLGDEVLHASSAQALMNFYNVMDNVEDAQRLRTILVNHIKGEHSPVPTPKDDTPTAPLLANIPKTVGCVGCSYAEDGSLYKFCKECQKAIQEA